MKFSQKNGQAALGLLVLALGGLALLQFFVMEKGVVPHYGWLAESFVRGRLDLIPNRQFLFFSVLQDMVFRDGRFFWHLGPFPAVAMTPLVAVGVSALTAQRLLQLLTVAGVGIVAFLFGRRSGASRTTSLWLTLIMLFGSVFIGVASIVGSWYLSQTMAVLLVMLGLLEYRGANRPWLIGIFCGLAVASRPMAGLALAGFFGLLTLHEYRLTRQALKRLALFALPVAVALAALAWYNWARFGDPFDNGYLDNLFLMPSPEHMDLQSRRSDLGLFNLAYLPFNLHYYFAALPKLEFGLPMVDSMGVSVLLVSPAFLLIAALRKWRTEHWVALAISIAALASFLCYFSTGYFQFAPRYLNDVLPFMFLLLVAALKDKKELGYKTCLAVMASLGLNFFLLEAFLYRPFY